MFPQQFGVVVEWITYPRCRPAHSFTPCFAHTFLPQPHIVLCEPADAVVSYMPEILLKNSGGRQATAAGMLVYPRDPPSVDTPGSILARQSTMCRISARVNSDMGVDCSDWGVSGHVAKRTAHIVLCELA